MGVHDILTGIALVLVIEGLAYALAPSLVERLLEGLRPLRLDQRRLIGLVSLGLGIGGLWLLWG